MHGLTRTLSARAWAEHAGSRTRAHHTQCWASLHRVRGSRNPSRGLKVDQYFLKTDDVDVEMWMWMWMWMATSCDICDSSHMAQRMMMSHYNCTAIIY